jgi:flagellar basal-body rod protein FlgB
MANFMVNDISYLAAKTALDGLSQRGQAISQNLANVDTPGYRAKTVDFEATLNEALKRSSRQLDLSTPRVGHINISASNVSGNMVQTVLRPGGTDRADQNNVDIDTELMDLNETTLRFETVSTMVNKKFTLLKSIANG